MFKSVYKFQDKNVCVLGYVEIYNPVYFMIVSEGQNKEVAF